MIFQKLVIIQILAFAVFFVDTAAAAPLTFNVDGVISDSTDQPLESASVTFTVQVKDSTETCLLYQETFPLSMTGSNGYFSLVVGKQTNGVSGGTTLDKVFSNVSTSIPGQSCTYTPSSASESRKIVVSFNDGSGSQVFTTQEIQSVPYAVAASEAAKFTDALSGDVTGSQTATLVAKIQGKPVDMTGIADGKILKYQSGSFVVADDATGTSGITSLNGLTAASQSFSAVDLGNSVLAPAWTSSTSAHTLKIPMASGTGVTAGLISNSEFTSFGTKITALTGDVTASGVGSVNATIGTGKVTSSHILDGTVIGADMDFTAINSATSDLVLKDSGTGKFATFTCATPNYVLTWTAAGWACQAPATTGLPLTGGTMSGAISMGSNNLISVGNLTMVPGGYLHLPNTTTNGGTAGQLWYDAGNIKYYDGSAVKTLSTGTSGMSNALSTGQIWVGNVSGGAEARSLNGDITSTSATGAVVVTKTTTGTANTILSLDGSSVATMAGVALVNAGTVTLSAGTASSNYVLKLPAASPTGNQVMQVDSLGNLSWIATPSFSMPALNDGLIWIGNGSNGAAPQTVGGDATISNAGVLTLKNTGTVGTYYKVTTDAQGRVISGSGLLSADVTTALTYTPLNKAGDTMSGDLGTQNINMAANTYLKLSSNSTDGSVQGQMWYDGGIIKYYDGSTVKSLGVAGAGITSLNGLTSASQTFVTGTSGTDFNLSFSGITHTFNLPSASATNRGALTSADWNTFNSKQSNTLASGNLLVGNTSGGAEARVISGDITIDSVGFTTLKSTGTVGTYSKVITDAQGRVTSGSALTGSDITTALTYTPLNKAGDTMSGTLSLGSNDMTNAGNITMSANKYLKLSANSTDGTTAGQVWYDTGVIKYYDGSTVKTLGIAGAGITSLNGLTTSSQTFYNGTGGNFPAFVSTGGGHTLNIPLASASGTVTQGLISNADYVTFNSKQSNALASGNLLVGNSSGGAQGRAISGDITIDSVGFTTLKNTGTLGTYFKVTTDAQGRVISGSALASGDVTAALGYTPSSGVGSYTNGGNSFGAAATLGTNDANTLSFKTNALTRVVIDTSGKVGIGSGAPNASLDMGSQTDAIIMPKGTTGTRPGSAVAGMVRYNTTNNNVEYYDGTSWTVIANALGYTPLNKAGDAMTGALAMGANDITNTGNITMAANKYFKLSANSTDGVSAGQMWYDSGIIKYFDGTTVKSLGVAGAGITSLNGLTTGAQTFGNGTAGNLPNWSSAGSGHTLNIPMANTTSVTAGLISKAEYDTFNSKQSTALGAGQVWVGNGSGASEARVLSGDIAAVSGVGLVTVDKTTTGVANKILSLDGTGVALVRGLDVQTGTGKVTLQTAGTFTNYVLTLPTTSGSANQVMANDGAGNLGWVTPLSSSTAFINGGNTFAGNSTIGLNDAYNLGFKTNATVRMTINSAGNVGIGTQSPSVSLDFTGKTDAIRLPNGTTAQRPTASAGMMRFNTSNTNMEYHDGTSWVTVGVSGAGISSLNGLTVAAQTFGNGTAGNLPNWSSSGSGHTLNIPMANTSAVTAGLISKTEYDTFNSKQSNTLASGNLFVGNASGGGQARAISGDITIDNVGFTTLKNTGTVGTYTKVVTDAQGRVISGGALVSADVTAALGYTPVNKAGDTMSGLLNHSGFDITNTGNITMAASKYLTLSNNTTSGTTAGQMWYDAGVIKYYDGSTVKSLGVAGAGISSLNGLTNTTQTFGTGTTGTSPNWNSSGSGHILHIPMANTASVTAGLISKTEYDNFNNKMSSALTAGTIWVGNSSNGAQAFALSGDIASVSNTGAVTVSKTTTGQVNKILSLDGSGVATMLGLNLVNTGTVSVQAQTASSSYILRLPASSPSANQVMVSDASGNLSWQTNPSLGYTPVNKAGDTMTGTLEVSGNIQTNQGQVYASQNVVASGSTIDFNTGNVQVVQSPGGASITLNNMKDGGSYTVIISDTTSRQYTFNNCTNQHFVPANDLTTAGTHSIYTILKVTISSQTHCYISWVTGF